MGHAFWKQKSDIEFNIVRNTLRTDLKISLGLKYLNFHYKLFLILLSPSGSSLWYRLVIFSIFRHARYLDTPNQTLSFSFFSFFPKRSNNPMIFFSQWLLKKKSCKLISHFCHFVHSWTTANRQKTDNSIEGF